MKITSNLGSIRACDCYCERIKTFSRLSLPKGCELVANFSGTADWSIQALSKSPVINANGTATIAVKNVDCEDLKINCSGSSTVEISNGFIDELVILSSGAHNFHIKSVVNNLSVNAIGAGNIDVKKVYTVKAMNLSGAIKLKIREGGKHDPTVKDIIEEKLVDGYNKVVEKISNNIISTQ